MTTVWQDNSDRFASRRDDTGTQRQPRGLAAHAEGVEQQQGGTGGVAEHHDGQQDGFKHGLIIA